MEQCKHTKQTAGRRGGLATLARHGPEHMRKIGQQGARVFWQRYTTQPTGLNDFAIVKRATGEVIGFTSGRLGK